ncbi:MAG: PhzF family phenazine biosynthesis protein [Gammaproteobacteria bacterium]|nr:MAG: PhzF family phenazine biosynthesis protein [Gammaproteobacteria bacterium]
MRLTIVDVFAEQRFAGNQLAVVEEAGDLSTEAMQDIAREMNFSETTFVTARTDDSAEVRIFTPAQELPFAGHPTIGTAWTLGRDREEFALELKAGRVVVRFDRDSGIAWMSPPPVILGDSIPGETTVKMVGLELADLNDELPVQWVECGPRFVFIGLKNLAALRRARLDPDLHAQLVAEGDGVAAVFLFAPEAYSADADYSARLFFNANGIREDPATGSANSGLAAYLRQHLGAPIDVIVEQGFEIQRPSRLYLKADADIAVGGKVQLVLVGDLFTADGA